MGVARSVLGLDPDHETVRQDDREENRAVESVRGSGTRFDEIVRMEPPTLELDDVVLSTWEWLNFATVTIQAGYVTFALISLLTGEVVTSSGSAPDDFYEIEIWTDRSFNVASKPMYLRMPAKWQDGTVRELEGVLYKVQFAPLTFDGPAYKDGLKINYSGKALLSSNDEAGNALGSYRAVARLRDIPTGQGIESLS